MRYKRKKGQNMGTVLSLQRHMDEKEEKAYPYSVIDMIFDPCYRKRTVAHYNNQYKETAEEKEILDAWTKRRKGNDD